MLVRLCKTLGLLVIEFEVILILLITSVLAEVLLSKARLLLRITCTVILLFNEFIRKDIVCSCYLLKSILLELGALLA